MLSLLFQVYIVYFYLKSNTVIRNRNIYRKLNGGKNITHRPTSPEQKKQSLHFFLKCNCKSYLIGLLNSVAKLTGDNLH